MRFKTQLLPGAAVVLVPLCTVESGEGRWFGCEMREGFLDLIVEVRRPIVLPESCQSSVSSATLTITVVPFPARFNEFCCCSWPWLPVLVVPLAAVVPRSCDEKELLSSRVNKLIGGSSTTGGVVNDTLCSNQVKWSARLFRVIKPIFQASI